MEPKKSNGEGGLDEYVSQFRTNAILAKVAEVKILARFFVDNLVTPLKDSMRKVPMNFATIDEYYQLAKTLDEQYHEGRRNTDRKSYGRQVRQMETNLQDPTIGKLSPQELDRCRKLGLCFNCKEQGHHTRDCPRRQNQYQNGYQNKGKNNGGRNIRQITEESSDDGDDAQSDGSNQTGPTIGSINTMLGKLSAEDKAVFMQQLLDQGF